MAIELKDLNSSLISQAGYDSTNNTLRIKFSNGQVYDYTTVTPSQAQDFLNSESPGKHFHANVKGKYPSSKFSEDE